MQATPLTTTLLMRHGLASGFGVTDPAIVTRALRRNRVYERGSGWRSPGHAAVRFTVLPTSLSDTT